MAEDPIIPTFDPAIGRIESREIVTEMQTSYLDYAMSVIVARALPDARDGLKPIHRRILYAMNEMGLRYNVKHQKSSKVVGTVMGNYHPHGDVAIYLSMVRMAQPFAMGQVLVDGQGNFGSMDGDPPAAQRYTEARMSKLASELLADIDKDTVDFVDTYDGTSEEPSVLPTKVPNLLLNGTVGIAVGMATNIPPHNLGELCDGVVALIDNAEIDLAGLQQHILGPDFPTGAEIHGQSGINDAFQTGRGKIVIRAVAEIEERKGGFRVVVSQIPYQVNKADLVAKIADLVKDKKIEGVTDIRDESNREGVRVVIELKASSFPKKVLNKLYELTPLQTSYHVNMLALVNELEPRVLNLKEVLQEFLAHRQIVVRRRSEYDLARAKERAHILEGLLKALDAIDEVVAIIRAAKNREGARNGLMERFLFSEIQANAILDMRLSALVGLERQRLQDEYNEKMRLIAYFEDLLAHEEKILSLIREETIAIKEQYAIPRRTRIIGSDIGKFSVEDLVPNEDTVVSITKTNYVKRVPRDTYRAQGRGGKGIAGMGTKDEDEVLFLFSSKTHDSIYFFTDKGKLYRTSVYEIPVASRQSKGSAMANLIQIGGDERVTAVLTLSRDQEAKGGTFIMVTTDGTVKKTEVAAYSNVRKNGIIAISLDEGNKLGWVRVAEGHHNILMVTEKGQAIIFKESDVRSTGRSAAGVRGMRLKPDDRIVAMDVLSEAQLKQDQVIVVCETGLGKRTPLDNFDIQGRGGMGIKAASLTSRTGSIVYAAVVDDTHAELLLISGKGTVLKLPMESVKSLGRVTQGVTLMRLNGTDKVASCALLLKAVDGEELIANSVDEQELIETE